MHQVLMGRLPILNIKQYNLACLTRMQVLMLSLFVLSGETVAFTPVDWYLIQDLSPIKYYDWLDARYGFNLPKLISPLVEVNMLQTKQDGDSAIESLMDSMQNGYPQLAQYLADVEWPEDSNDLVTLLGYFLEHPEQAHYFNNCEQVSTHPPNQVIDALDPVLMLIQTIKSHPDLPWFALLQTAPLLTQFLVDSIGHPVSLVLHSMIRMLVQNPSIARLNNKVDAVVLHRAGNRVKNNHHVLINLRMLSGLEEETLAAINEHILEKDFYPFLINFSRTAPIGNCLFDVTPGQLVVLVQHPDYLQELLLFARNVQLEKEQLLQFLRALANHIQTTDDCPARLSKKQLIEILIKELYAQQLADLNNTPLVYLLEAGSSDNMTSGVTTLFLITRYQNFLAYLNGQNARFANIDATALQRVLASLVVTNQSRVYDFLQKLVDNPVQIATHLSSIDKLATLGSSTQAEGTFGADENLVVSALETRPGELAGELVQSFLATQPLNPSDTEQADGSETFFNAAHTAILRVASAFIPANHPANDVLVAMAYSAGIRLNQLESFMAEAQSLLIEMQMDTPEDYHRIRFVLRLIARMEANDWPPFCFIQRQLLAKNYPVLSRVIQNYLGKELNMPEATLEKTAFAIIHILTGYPDLFIMLGPIHLAIARNSNKFFVQMLEQMPEAELEQIIEFLFLQPALLATPLIAHQSGSNLDQLLRIISSVNTDQIRQLSGLQLFFLHTALVSHTSHSSLDTPPQQGLAAGFLNQMIVEHLLPIWPEHISLNIDILIDYLFSQIEGLDQAMHPDTIRKILGRYFH